MKRLLLLGVVVLSAGYCALVRDTHHARSRPSRSLGSASLMNLPCEGWEDYAGDWRV